MPDPRAYDLVVVGSGPAGEKGAAQAAYFGKRVALVEKDAPRFGGAGTNTGTLPSKTLRESALALSGMLSRGLERAVLALPRPYTRATLMHRLRIVTEAEHGRLRGDFVLLATGSRPHRPEWIPFDAPEVYDSDEILDVEVVPESMIVLGSGVIACEYACLFAALGTRVTLLDGRDRLLGFLDAELGDRFRAELERLGLALRLGDAPEACAVDPATRQCTVATRGGHAATAAGVLAAAGRNGNSAGLGLEEIGIRPDKRGNVPVDDGFRTAVPHVFAAGDLVGFHPTLAELYKYAAYDALGALARRPAREKKSWI